MNLERTILTNLDRVHPRLMTVNTLWSEVYADIPESSYTEFKSALGELEQKGQALVLKGEDRDKAKITDAGRARLME
jgi:hypothetical protein